MSFSGPLSSNIHLFCFFWYFLFIFSFPFFSVRFAQSWNIFHLSLSGSSAFCSLEKWVLLIRLEARPFTSHEVSRSCYSRCSSVPSFSLLSCSCQCLSMTYILWHASCQNWFCVQSAALMRRKSAEGGSCSPLRRLARLLFCWTSSIRKRSGGSCVRLWHSIFILRMTCISGRTSWFFYAINRGWGLWSTQVSPSSLSWTKA